MGVLVGLLTAASWAIGSCLMRDLSRKLDPFTLNAPRSLVGGLAMVILAVATGRTVGYRDVTTEKLFFMLSSMAIGGGIGDSFYVLSMARIGVSRAFPIANIYPALTMILGVLFLQETITPAVIGGLVLVLGGVLFMSGLPILQRGRRVVDPSRPASPARIGTLLALAAAVCWATSSVLIAPGIEGLDKIMVASIRTPALSLMCWGIVGMRKTWPAYRELSRKEWIIIIVGGLIGWGLGSVLFLISVSMLGPTRSAILTSTSPLFALPLSIIFLHEKVDRWVIIGTIMVVLGIILVS